MTVLMAVFGLALAAAPLRAQQIVYVNASAPPGGNGSTWGTAFNNLQTALTFARPIGAAGNQIHLWVAAGVYKPAALGGPRSATFAMSNNVTVLGGFAGTENQVNERRPGQFETILSGDLAGDDPLTYESLANQAQINAVLNDNVFHVVSFIGTNNGLLDGCTVTGGSANNAPSGGTDGFGAGVYASGGFLTMRNCTVRNNFAYNAAGSGFAAVWHNGGSIVSLGTLEDCVIRDNRSINLAAIGVNRANGVVSLNFVNCTIAFNHAGILPGHGFGGGGIIGVINSGSNPTLTFTSCIIQGNTSQNGPICDTCVNFVTVRSSNVQFATGPLNTGGTGNIDADPQFVNPATRDLRLASGSPCMEAGLTSDVGSNFSDADGNRRVFDGDGNGIGSVDMGAYEFGAPVYSSRLYVRAGAPAGGQGSSWSTAFPELRGALAFAAQPFAGTSEIWVAQGVYSPAAAGGSREAKFTLANNLALYGGFAGTESLFSQRNVSANPTILSGDLNRDDFGEVNLTDNSYTIVSAPSNSNRTCVLDGFTLTAANNSIGTGGGYLFPATGATGATIRQCTFRGNRAFGGAALTATSVALPGLLVEGCLFEANRATAAGTGGSGAFQLNAGRATLNDCVFVENAGRDTASGLSGGAARLFNGAEATFERCVFLRNTGGNGAAVSLNEQPAGTFRHCQFLGNVASGSGAIFATSRVRLTVIGCLFAGNRAGTGSGAIVSTNSGSVTSTLSHLIAINTVITGNVSAGGSGSVDAGALALGNENGHYAHLTNTILFGNTAANTSGQSAQVNAVGSAPLLRYCTVQGYDGTFGGGIGNNALDPLFLRAVSPGTDLLFGTIDDDYGDLRLGSGSPAIDSGDSLALPADASDADGDGNLSELLPVDILGLPRIVDDPATPNTGPGGPPHVDRGAYEVQVNCLACPGTREWRNPAGGLFSDFFNWFPSVPNASHDTLHNLSATYTVDLNAAAGSTVSNRSATFENGHVTLNPGAATYALTTLAEPALTIAGGGASEAALTINGGRVTAASATIARGEDSVGVLNVTGASARLVVAPLDLYVGFGGAGTMNITGGAQVTSRIAAVATLPGASGTVLVDGPGSRWSIPFYLTIDNGTVTVRNGGTLQAGFGIFLLQSAVLNGDGTILGDVVNFGRIEPGNSPGTLTVTGAYTQVGEIPEFGSSSGKLMMQVEGVNPGQFDRLVVQGTTQLGGGLIVEAPAGGFPQPPEGGLSLPIIDALGGIAISEATGLPADRFDVAFFPRVPPTGGVGPSDKFLKLERPEGGGAAFFNLTTGTLGAPININDPANTSASATPSAVIPADLDGDGLDDLALATPGSNAIVILMNRGTVAGQWQGFEGAVQYGVGVNPQGLAFGDVDGDGVPDLAVANQGSDSVSLLRNFTIPGSHLAAFTIQGTLNTSDGPTGVELANFDGSGTRPVVVTADETGGQMSIFVRGAAPGFTFQPRINKPIPANVPPRQPRDLDIDGEGGQPDLALLSVGGSSVIILPNISMGTGIVAFGDPIILPVGADPSELVVAQLRDGRSSLVTTNAGDGTMSVLINTADAFNPARFAPAVSIPAGTAPRSLTPLDVDADSDADLAVLTDTGEGANPLKVRIFRNDYFVGNLQGNDQVTFVSDRDLPDDGAPADALFVLSARLASPTIIDLLTVTSQGGARDPGGAGGSMALNIRPRLNLTTGGISTCFVDFNNDGFVEPGDLDEFITSYFSDFEAERARCDFNSDGFVEPGDLDEYITSYFEGC